MLIEDDDEPAIDGAFRKFRVILIKSPWLRDAIDKNCYFFCLENKCGGVVLFSLLEQGF